MAKPANVTAVIGAQYGSEGKGVIVQHLANRFAYHVRVGGPNAGHSFYHNGQLYKMQSIPCGWVNPDAILVIGRGGLVSIDVLVRELEMLGQVDSNILDRLVIDAHAGVLSEEHHQAEGGVYGDIHLRIGSTGEGVGAVRHARMARDPRNFEFFGDVAERYGLERYVHPDTVRMLSSANDRGESILLEGTQGSGLSLIHGPWPYVTSADTNVATLLADTGLAPAKLKSTILVARTYPIRVAGNSGPLKGELSWESLSQSLGRDVLERTTVTKKIRRVGTWDEELVERAILLNSPTSIAVTFLDYLNSADTGVTEYDQLSVVSKSFLRYINRWSGIPVSMVGTGGDQWHIIDLGPEL